MAESILVRLTENIDAATKDPSQALDHRLFDEAELVLPESLNAEKKQQIVASLAGLLPTLQQDPTPAVNLLLRLVPDYTFGDVLKLGNVPFTDGLAVGDHMVAFNRLIIALLSKAAAHSVDAATVAGMLDTVLALVRLWLCTADTGIAMQASQLLLDLLKVDQEIQTDPDAYVPTGGQGLVWKRIFGDRDVYRTFFDVCSLKGKGESSTQLSKNQRTLAQARLLEWLPKVAVMDWNAISRSHHADIEQEYSVEGGLLDFAALHMVDIKDDILMYRCLVDFFSDMLHSTRPLRRVAGAATDSAGLRYLIAGGLHTRTAALYLQLPGTSIDPLESMFLYGPAANYLATYASQYPEHFMASQMPQQIIERLKVALGLSPGQWAHSDSPKHDLHLLASVPRRAIIATTGGIGWNSSPLSLLPSKATNPDVLNTLATIFHGPEREDVVFPIPEVVGNQDSARNEEAAEARALYYHYLANNPLFWSDIATHADTVALKDHALAAINCLTSVINATWSEQPEVPLPTTIATPESGCLAILAPPALEYTMPCLLKQSPSFANLVGGRGDPESSAYKIAQARYDAVRAFSSRLGALVESHPRQGYEEIVATLNRRLAEGPLSREGEVGGRIGTLEL